MQSEDSDVCSVAVTFTIPGDEEESTGIWATDDLKSGTALTAERNRAGGNGP